MNSSVRNAVLWVIMFGLAVLVWAVFKGSQTKCQQPTFSELYQDVQEGKVESITINAATGEVPAAPSNASASAQLPERMASWARSCRSQAAPGCAVSAWRASAARPSAA